jgi:hypothetical protein
MNALFAGIHPLLDHKNQPWDANSYGARHAGLPLTSEGHFGVLHSLCGDMAWFAERLRLGNVFPNSAKPCAFCECDRSDLPFKDLRGGAAWKATCKRPPQAAPNTSPIWTIIGATLFAVRLDLMHIFDLGVLPHFIGSCLFSLIYNAETPGATVDLRLQNIWRRIKELYREFRSNCRISRLTLHFFCNPSRPRADFPFFKGKAAENRQFLPVIAALCREFSSGSPRDLARITCADNFLIYLQTCTRGGFILTAGEAGTARTALQTALDSYMFLSFQAATTERRPSFNIVNKHHFLHHMADSVFYINPEAVWNYQWEDLVGRAQRVAMSSKSGTRAVGIPAGFMKRYRRVLHTHLR